MTSTGWGRTAGDSTITTVNCVGVVRLAVTAMTPVQVLAAADAHRFAAEVARQAASRRYYYARTSTISVDWEH